MASFQCGSSAFTTVISNDSHTHFSLVVVPAAAVGFFLLLKLMAEDAKQTAALVGHLKNCNVDST